MKLKISTAHWILYNNTILYNGPGDDPQNLPIPWGHWRQPRRGCRGHIPQYFGWGDVNGNIPANRAYYYVLLDIADQYWLPSVRSASSRFPSAIRRHQFASVRQADSRLTRLVPPNLELALTPLPGGIQARNQAHRSLVPRELSCTTLSYRESRRDRWILAGRVSRGDAAAGWWSRPRRSWSDECRASASETRTWREDSSTSPNLHSPPVQRRQYYHTRPEYAL